MKAATARLMPVIRDLQKSLNEITWSWENDAGRACNEIAEAALEKLKPFVE